MDLSVIICSYNRSHNLPQCFDALVQQANANGISWEIILVDNNSTDNTRLVTEHHIQLGSLPLRYTFEKNQGLSYARNCGVGQAKGDYLVFIDDDIRVTPNWLCSIYKTCQQHDYDVVGGRIHVDSPSELPKWIGSEMYGFLGHQDFGEKSYEMDGFKEFPFGGNMAIHRRVFKKIGMFDTEMGRKGEGLKKNELFKGEETDFFHRLAATGGTFIYNPDMIVAHKILPHQIKKRFFLTLHNNAGTLKAKKDENKYDRTLSGIPLFLFSQFGRSIYKYCHQMCVYGPDHSFRQLMNIVYFMGMLRGYYVKAKTTKP